MTQNKFINCLKEFENKDVRIDRASGESVEGLCLGIDYANKDVMIDTGEGDTLITDVLKMVLLEDEQEEDD
ncbi:hypothetical protein GF336_00245 [Candidatus Woesearchaeota archaeon]|nr:hypothetical protein [Candidatus Woesearchaeota archaeon]